MPINYVLIDFENVQPKSLDHLAHHHFKIIVFVGARQTKPSFETATSMPGLRHRVDYIQISGKGSNALDFHIAYYIGRLAVADPSAHFHVLSKDAGFDPLIDHLRTNEVFAGRVNALSDIPLVKSSVSTSLLAERVEAIVARLRKLKSAKPRRVKTLRSTIGALFQKQLSEKEVSRLVKELVKREYLIVSGAKVTYALTSES